MLAARSTHDSFMAHEFPYLPREYQNAYSGAPLEPVIASLAVLKNKIETKPEFGAVLELFQRANSVLAVDPNCRWQDVIEFLALEGVGEPTAAPLPLVPALGYARAIEASVSLAMREPVDAYSADGLKAIHRLLTHRMAVKGSPGEFRTDNTVHSSRWLWNVRSARPPADVLPYIEDLADFLLEPPTLPLPLRACLVWGQICAIRPFEYGSHEVAQIVMQMMFAAAGYPPISVPAMFGHEKELLESAIQDIRDQGSWSSWLHLSLGCIATSAEDAAASLTEMEQVSRHLETKIGGVRKDAAARAVLDLLMRCPVISVSSASRDLQLSFQTVNAAVRTLQLPGVLAVLPSRADRRHRLFVASEFVSVLLRYLHLRFD